MDTVLVTGANGFFASRLIEHYKNKYKIIGLSHNELEITNEQETLQLVEKYRPDFLIHAAAISDTGICERNREQSYQVNVQGSANIAKACSASKTKLVYLSSDQVYNGNSESGPYREDDIAIPDTAYGNQKMEAENKILEITNQAVILRLTWMFSLPERQKKTNANLVWNIVKAALKQEAIRFPLHEFRGITYVYDLIENFDAILSLPGGIYNTGSENNLNTYEIAAIVLGQLGLKHKMSEILIPDMERYQSKDRDLRISNDKLKKYNIYFPSTQEAIRRCIKDFSFQIL